MESASDHKKPEPKKPGPEPERLVIPEEDAEEALDRFLGKKAEDPNKSDGDEEKPEGS